MDHRRSSPTTVAVPSVSAPSRSPPNQDCLCDASPARRHTRIRLRSLCVHRKAMTYDGCVELWWAEEDADYIRTGPPVTRAPWTLSRSGIAYRDLDGELHGMNAWPASGRDLATYRRAVSDDEEK